MKNFINLLSLLLIFTIGCSEKEQTEESLNKEYEVPLHISVESEIPQTKALSYLAAIQHMRILVFDGFSNVLFRQIALPNGSNAPTTLRLPWGNYYIVFLGNFQSLTLTPGTTTLNDLLVSMNTDPLYPTSIDIYKAPAQPYYYYKTDLIQFGIVASINVTLRPITSRIIFRYQNKPLAYTGLQADIHGIGKNLSLQGVSLPPIGRVIKSKQNLSLSGNISDTTYTFSSIGSLPWFKLYATKLLQRDSLSFTFKTPIQTGKSYIVNFIFPSVPELRVSGIAPPSYPSLKGVRIVCEEEKIVIN